MSITINGTTGIAGVDGSAGTPAIQGTDTNTGEFFPAADTIAWTTGGSERVRVDSSGNVGIGTASPFTKLTVSGYVLSGGQNYSARFTDAINSTFSIAHQSGLTNLITDTGMAFYTSNTEQGRITNTGVLQFNSGYGSVATAYGCRAWVNFNGTTATPSTIRGSGNVTSVTKNGTGDYTVNFTTAMPDTNYSVFGCSDGAGGASWISLYGGGTPYTTSSIRFGVTTGASVDRTYVNISIFR